MKIEIKLTQAEKMALSHVIADPTAWAKSVIYERARKAVVDIGQAEINRLISEGKSITSSQDQLVVDAFKSGQIRAVNDEAEKPSVTSKDVRFEAQRRMIVLVGARDAPHLSLIIENGTREAVRLLTLGKENWGADQQKRAAILDGVDQAIEAIRDASNALEVSLSDDYQDDKHWP